MFSLEYPNSSNEACGRLSYSLEDSEGQPVQTTSVAQVVKPGKGYQEYL